MKHNKNILLAFSFLIVLFGCHKDNPPVIESITLSSDLEEIHIGQQMHFSVVANTGENVTSQSVFYRNKLETKDSLFSPTEVGTYEVYAKYKEIVSNTIKVKVNEKPIESIKIESGKNEIILGEPFTFSIVANTGKDITSQVKVFVNDKLYDKNKVFFPKEVGDYVLYATYQYKGTTLKTDKVAIKVLSTNATSFVKHPIVEGYTHSKCPWCPRLYYALKKLDEVTDKVIFVSHHPINRSNWVDFLHSKESIPLWEDFKAKYKQYNSDNYKSHTVPNADIDRDMFWGKPQPEKLKEVTDRLNEKSLIGLALGVAKNEGKLNISVRTQFLQDFDEELKLTVYVLENNIVHDYPNVTEYFDGIRLIKDFVSNHVFRHSLTDIYGDNIPQDKTNKDKLYIKNFSVAIPNNITDKEKISVAAFVTSKNILNARVISLGDKEQLFENK